MKRKRYKLFLIIMMCLVIIAGLLYMKDNHSIKKQAKEIEVAFSENNITDIGKTIFDINSSNVNKGRTTLNEKNEEFLSYIFEHVEIKCENVNKDNIVYEIKYPHMKNVFADYEKEVTEKERSELGFYKYLKTYVKKANIKNKKVILKYDYIDGKIKIDYNNADFVYAITGGLLDKYEKLYENMFTENDEGLSKQAMAYGVKQADKKSAKAVWKSYLSTTDENEIFFLMEDYDGDGQKEAFGITGSVVDDISYNYVKIYFVSSSGNLSCVKNSTFDGSALYGFLAKQLTEEPLAAFKSLDKESCYITVKNSKFIVWEISANGSGSTSVVLGVRNGEAYEPEVSGKVMNFRQKKSKEISSLESDFSKGYHDYIEYSYFFNESIGEFSIK